MPTHQLLTYDFESRHPRTEFASTKWLEMGENFGSNELIPLWVADMDFKVAPPIQQAIHQMADHSIYGYMYRSPEYFNAIVKWYEKRHQWHIEPDWLQFSPGVLCTMSFLIQALTNPSDHILIQEPVYPPFKQKIMENQRIALSSPLQIDERGYYHIDFKDFEQQLYMQRPKLFILCNPHNPVGRVWTKEELTTLGELCLKYHVKVISDEIHSDLVFWPHKHVPFASISESFSQNSITLSAPSKTFNLAGLQTSFSICPNLEIRKQLRKSLDLFELSRNNSFNLVATQAAYEHGQAWLDELLIYLKANADYVSNFFNEHLMDIRVSPLEGTYLVWLDMRGLGLTEVELETRLIKTAKVALLKGSLFGQNGTGFFRMNIACPRSLLEEALNRMLKALR
jgi:cystathionine beta-lyase